MSKKLLEEIWHDDSDNTLWRRIKEGFTELLIKVAGKFTTNSLLVGGYPLTYTDSQGKGLFCDSVNHYTSIDPSNKYVTLYRATGDTSGNYLQFLKSRGTLTSRTVVTAGDDIGLIRAYAHDGTSDVEAARITFDTTGTIATGRVGGVIRFYVHPDSTSSIAEIGNFAYDRLAINTGYDLTIGGVSYGKYTAGTDRVLGCLSTVQWGSANTSMTIQTTSWTAKKNGTVTVVFSLLRWATAGTAYGQIYVNGTAAGTLRSSTSTTPTSYSENINVSAGDTIAIYGYVSSSSYRVNILNAYITSAYDGLANGNVSSVLAGDDSFATSVGNMTMPAMFVGQTMVYTFCFYVGEGQTRTLIAPSGGSYIIGPFYGLLNSVSGPGLVSGGTTLGTKSIASGDDPEYVRGSYIITRIT